MKSNTRRSFLKTSTLTGAGAFILPRISIARPGDSASKRVNLAFVGCGGIAHTYIGQKDLNVVAMCDVDSGMIAETKKKFPYLEAAREFADFRVMLDKMEKDIDIVVISTPDHTHFPATMEAMQRGKHVFTQKPLTHDIWQARTLVKAAEKYGVHTVMGNQGHTSNGIRQMRDWYDGGLLGQINQVNAWFSGGLKRVGGNLFPLPKQAVPEDLDWDLWLGPAQQTPYNKAYAPFSWRQFQRFGCGKLGDWFCHICDGPVWTLDLYEPTVIEAVKLDEESPGRYPGGSIIQWDFPERGDKVACTLRWHDGKNLPTAPADYSSGSPSEKAGKPKIPKFGSFWEGDGDSFYLDHRSSNPRYASRDKMIEAKKANAFPPEKHPRVEKGGPLLELIRAVAGEGPEPGSNFAYAARLTEVGCLGMIAQCAGGRIEWDSKNMKITNRPELNAMVKQPVRKGWKYGEDLWKS
ncbi:Gfo/Idh/MocA family oxidoreductase [Haloferula chungangensis]|uniref:Gfo/Idh/MocA family oxidoreductase n=1 Tax=Haloferula chungangensis TaxID=1048331 RepID=A0ABW2L2V5_9BACT